MGCIVHTAEDIYHKCAHLKRGTGQPQGPAVGPHPDQQGHGHPGMLLLLGLIFWITISGANVPPQMLGISSSRWRRRWRPGWRPSGCRRDRADAQRGMYRTLAWVVSVMLPPMAIFFPLFTLLEDSGYLPRTPNMDAFFKKARAHGKQALTMCMGFGCNACGGDRLPHHRLAPGATDRHPDQQFRALQRALPDADRHHHDVLRRGERRVRAVGAQRADAHRVIVLGVAMTLWISRLLSKTVLGGRAQQLRPGAAAHRRPLNRQGHPALDLPTDALRAGRAVAVAAGGHRYPVHGQHPGEISLLAQCAGSWTPSRA